MGTGPMAFAGGFVHVHNPCTVDPWSPRHRSGAAAYPGPEPCRHETHVEENKTSATHDKLLGDSHHLIRFHERRRTMGRF